MTPLISNGRFVRKLQRHIALTKMETEHSGCFTWFISFKKTCNERWARFRNRFREKYYKSRGKTLDPSTVLNETGTKEMVVSNKRYKSNKVVPLSQDHCAFVEKAQTLSTDNALNQQVEEYVSAIIHEAANKLILEIQKLPSNDDVIHVKPADDTVSLSSSTISQIADKVVGESLTHVALESEIFK